jgi:polygalacturonase
MTPILIDRRALLLSTAAMAACTALPKPSVADPWARADAIANAVQAPRISARDYSILDFGAASGRDVRPAIIAALDAAEAVGGGRVVLPQGVWPCDGPIHMRSSCAIHLEADARLIFSGNAASYLPVVFTRWEGTEAYNYSPMIYGRDLTDIAITGEGTIDGQGEANFLPWRPNQKPDQQALRRMGAQGTPVSERVFGEGHWLRPQFVQFVGCERVLVEGVTLIDSPFWCVHPVYCRHVTVRGVTIVSRHINSDGVDPDSSEDVLIERCTFDTGDDGVALKAGRDQDGWRVGRQTRRIVIRNNRYAGTRGGGMAIGSEMSGGIETVFVDGFAMNEVHHALYFKANPDRGGRIRDVYIRGVRARKADTVLIFTNDYHGYRGGDFPTLFEDVWVEDVRVDEAAVGISVVGHQDAFVRDVSVRNMRVGTVEIPLRARYVANLRFDNVVMGGETIRAVTQTAPETFERVTKV